VENRTDESRYSLPKPVEVGECMAHYYIYGDESGKLKQSEYTSFCGYVGPSSAFERVMVEWDHCRFAWAVPPLHMRCIMKPERDSTGEWLRVKEAWGNAWEKKRQAMLLEFGAILGRSYLACVGCAIDAAHFKAMPDSQFKRDMQDPLFMGLYILLMNSIDKVDVISKTSTISVVIDEDEEYAVGCYELLSSVKRRYPRVKQRISAVTFGSDREYPALQAADMIAFESRRLLVDKQTAQPSQLYELLTRNGLHQPNLCTAEHLNEVSKGGA